MSTNSPKFYRRIGWGLVCGGVVILILTAAMNYFQGDLIGVTSAGKMLNSLGSVAIDSTGIVLCGLAAGACWAAWRWGWGLVFTVALVGSAAWSANSILSFQAAERMSASSHRASLIARDAEADKLSKEHAKWLRGSAVNSDSRTERKDYLKSASEEIAKYRNTKTEARIQPDAGSQWWASWTGWSLERVQLSQSAYFALLLIFLKSVCFSGAGFFLSWSPAPSGGSVSAKPEGGGGTMKAVETPKGKKPETVAARQAEIVPLRKAEAPVAPSSVKPRQSLSEFLQERPGVTYTSQAALAKAAGLSPATVHRHLGNMEGRGKPVRRSKQKRGAKAVTYGERSASHAFG
jgi:hypothetical protein